MKIFKKNDLLIWRMTKWCNYRCPYCQQSKEVFPNESGILKDAKTLNSVIEKSKKATNIEMLGGEISYFDLKKILNVLDSKFIKTIKITSNLSNKLEVYKELAKDERVNLTGSMHVTQIKDPTAFFENAKFAKSIKVVINPDNINTTIEFIKNNIKNVDLKKINLTFDNHLSMDDVKKTRAELLVLLKKYNINLTEEKSTKYFVEDNNKTEALTKEEIYNKYDTKNFKGKKCSTYVYFKDGLFYAGSCGERAKKIIKPTTEPFTDICKGLKNCSLCKIKIIED